MTTAVCFDLDGTLVEISRPYRSLLKETISAHVDLEATGAGPDVLASVYDEAFFSAMDAFDPAPVEAGARAVFDAAGGTGDPSTFADTLREVEYAATMPRPGAEVLLDRLADRPLGVVTNGVADWQRGKLAHHGLLDKVDEVVTSYEARAHKPDPAPFAVAEERLMADAYTMVGDDPEADVLGARDRGWTAVNVADVLTSDPDGDPRIDVAALVARL